MTYKLERALQKIASLNNNTQGLEDARKIAIDALATDFAGIAQKCLANIISECKLNQKTMGEAGEVVLKQATLALEAVCSLSK